MKCLVVDDDPLVCDTVEQFLSQIADVEFCVKTGDGLTALNLLSSGGFELLFLDLQMPGLDGESLLKALPRQIPVVVISATKDFGARSYDFDVADYLVKPLEFPRFALAVHKARSRLDHSAKPAAEARHEIFLRDGTKLVRIDLRELLLVKAEANYCDFVLEGKSLLSLMSMKRAEQQLPAHFIRVHRSYIVNREHITRVEDGFVIIGQHKVPVGESYRDELRRALPVLS